MNRSRDAASSDCWLTPPEVLHPVREVLGDIHLDPCGHPDSAVNARTEWYGLKRGSEDGLAQEWCGYGPVFANPPFGRALKPWTSKIAEEGDTGAEIIALLPASPGTAWFHEHVMTAQALCFWRGRMRFMEMRGGERERRAAAMFDTMLAYWGPRPWRFCDVFAELGAVVPLGRRTP